jgi:hypothetical protein
MFGLAVSWQAWWKMLGQRGQIPTNFCRTLSSLKTVVWRKVCIVIGLFLFHGIDYFEVSGPNEL